MLQTVPIVRSSTYRRCSTCRRLWRKDYDGPSIDEQIPCPNCEGPQEGVVHESIREPIVNEALSQLSCLTDPELDDLLHTAVAQEEDPYRALATAIFCRGSIVAHGERWAVKFALMERGCLRSG